MLRLTVSGLAIFLIIGFPFSGQDSGSIQGVVVDEAGAIIPFSKVYLMKLKLPEPTETNTRGMFSVEDLEEGTYALLIKSSGFEDGFIANIQVQSDVTRFKKIVLRIDPSQLTDGASGEGN